MLKSKITKKGDLYVCLIDERFPANNDEFFLNKNTNFKVNSIKLKYFYKMDNIGKLESKKVPIKYKEYVDNKMIELTDELQDNGIKIIKVESQIEFYKPEKEKETERECERECERSSESVCARNSCKMFDCIKF
jgi:hypothetical protein